MRISDWSSDVCSSDLRPKPVGSCPSISQPEQRRADAHMGRAQHHRGLVIAAHTHRPHRQAVAFGQFVEQREEGRGRSEEHTSELQSLMRISYAVFCLKKKKQRYELK